MHETHGSDDLIDGIAVKKEQCLALLDRVEPDGS